MGQASRAAFSILASAPFVYQERTPSPPPDRHRGNRRQKLYLGIVRRTIKRDPPEKPAKHRNAVPTQSASARAFMPNRIGRGAIITPR